MPRPKPTTPTHPVIIRMPVDEIDQEAAIETVRRGLTRPLTRSEIIRELTEEAILARKRRRDRAAKRMSFS